MIEILSVKLYDVADVCKLFGVNRQTLAKYPIRHTTIAGKTYFSESALIDYLNGNKNDVAQTANGAAVGVNYGTIEIRKMQPQQPDTAHDSDADACNTLKAFSTNSR